jgi:tetratricopeptide (TPR) repeat protein
MIARLAGLATICMITMGAAVGPVFEVTPARELQAASRLARDGDLQADWNKLLDARARLERLVQHRDIAALAHYQLGYLEWRLSSLVYMSTGFRGQAPHWRRAVSELEQAVASRPDLADAHALIALCTAALLSTDPSQAERLRPRMESAWKAALDPSHTSPRALLLRAMTVFGTPSSYGGSQPQGLELWREAIAGLEKEKTTDPLAPEWGLAEAWGWLGGAYLMQGDNEKAVPAFQRALELRKDFWWVSRVAMPQAKRPALSTSGDGTARTLSAFVRVRVSFVVSEWLEAVWAAIRSVLQQANSWSREFPSNHG